MSDHSFHDQLSSTQRSLGPRLSLLWSHWSIRLLLLTLLLSIWHVAMNWHPLYAVLIPLGMLSQMLTEYSIHRHIFHLPPPRRQFWFNVLYLCHYGHHDFPTIPKLFFVPIWFVGPVMAAGFALYCLVFWAVGLPAPMTAAVAFVLIGHILTFLGYEWYHMTAHLNVQKYPVERYVTQRHSIHHFKDFTTMFHVSHGGVWIDRAMGTAVDETARSRIARLEFVRTLGMQPDDPRLIAARERYADWLGLSARQVRSAGR